MSDKPICYFCEATGNLKEVRPNNFLCSDCLPVQHHVVSCTIEYGSRVASCECGWTYRAPKYRDDGFQLREQAIKVHWNEVVSGASK